MPPSGSPSVAAAASLGTLATSGPGEELKWLFVRSLFLMIVGLLGRMAPLEKDRHWKTQVTVIR